MFWFVGERKNSLYIHTYTQTYIHIQSDGEEPTYPLNPAGFPAGLPWSKPELHACTELINQPIKQENAPRMVAESPHGIHLVPDREGPHDELEGTNRKSPSSDLPRV